MSNNRKRLPGSEKLTRPEDINALSKYLGDIRKTQEEHTELDKDNLEIPGRTTGRIPKISKLPDGKETLDAIQNVELEDYIDSLDVSSEPSLENRRLDLEDNRDLPLETKREDLEVSENDLELGTTKIDLENAESEVNLDETKVNLEVNGEVDLDTTKIDLEDIDQENNLDNTKIGLDNTNEEISLDETKLNLKVDEDNLSLDNTRVDIDVITTQNDSSPIEAELEETKIEITSNINLEQSGVDVENLDKTRIDIEDDNKVELEKDSIHLDAKENIQLDDTKVNLEIDSNVDLDDTRIDIEDNRQPELSNERIDIEKGEETPLDDTKVERGGSDKEVSLDDFIDTIDDKRKPELSKERVDIDGKEIKDLSNTIIKGIEKIEPELEETRLDIEKEDIKELEDTKLAIEDVVEVDELYDNTASQELPEDLNQEDDWYKKELYDALMTAPDDQKYEKALQMAESMGPWGMKVASLISSVLSNDSVDSKTAAWFDSELKKILNQMGALSKFGADMFDQSGDKAKNLKGDNAELEGESSRKERPESLKDEIEELPVEVVERPSASNSTYVPGSGNPREEKEYNLVEKLFGLYERPFSKSNNTQGYPTIPKYQLPSRGLLDTLNISNYIRFGVEELFGLWDPSTMAERKIKGVLLNEALALLVLAREQVEKLTKSNRERLPGDDMGLIGDLVSGGASGALDNLKNNAMSALQNTFAGVDGVDKLNPLNRPRTKMVKNSSGYGVSWVKEVTKGFDKGNDRQEKQSGDMKWDQLGKNLGKNLVDSLIGGLADMNKDRELDFAHKDGDSVKNGKITKGHGLGYINNPAMITTLSELCELSNPETQLDSLEALKEVLKESPYITTPRQFGTIEAGKYGTMTLDTNSYWEVVIEPFCHKSMNGGYSFLPAIEEINVINQSHFGVKTAYNKWIPIINFELQKSKLTNKSLGLYDGEIVYPVTSELSNELRMTIVDDQYKSWRTYFQKCADVSVYSSEAHSAEYYNNLRKETRVKGKDANGWIDPITHKMYWGTRYFEAAPHITVVDRSRPLVALYKNITFLIKIYIMTPQYATIRKFNLLCVLKDFEETYSGDIDAGGYDLNLSFSIVGENPPLDDAGSIVKAEKKKSLNEILGGKNKDLLNQPPGKKGGIIKLL